MSGEWQHVCYKPGFDKHVETLTPSQKKFPYLFHDWIRNPNHRVVIVAGGPGTGKTYAVIQSLNFVRISQLRIAPTARVAHSINGSTLYSALRLPFGPGSVLERLHKELELETDTNACIAKSEILLLEFDCRLSPRIIVLDEVGMMPFWMTHWIIKYFFQKARQPNLFVVMGDSNQLRPVRSNHNIFNVPVAFEHTRIDLLESKRFTHTYDRIVERLRHFVEAQDTEGMVGYIGESFPIVECIDSTVLKKCTRALAYKKSSVESYNAFYLKYMVSGPVLRLWKEGEGRQTFVDVKTGCLVFVTQNGVSEVPNGTCLVFETYNRDTDEVECSSLAPTRGRVVVRRNTHGEFPITVGFAATIHKFQGDTIDDAAVTINFNESTDLNLMYTALSRVRNASQIVAIAL